MRRTVQVLLGIVALHAMALLQSCWRCNEGESTYFDVNGISAQHQHKSLEDSVKINMYSLLLEAQVSYYAFQSEQSNWGSSAFASQPCDPALPGNLGSQEKIKSLIITSDAPWDSLHGAGSVLNDLVYARGYYDFGYEEWEEMPVDSIVNNQPPATRNIRLRFTQEPPIGKKHVFHVQYEQTNGEKYSATLPAITFK